MWFSKYDVSDRFADLSFIRSGERCGSSVPVFLVCNEFDSSPDELVEQKEKKRVLIFFPNSDRLKQQSTSF